MNEIKKVALFPRHGLTDENNMSYIFPAKTFTGSPTQYNMLLAGSELFFADLKREKITEVYIYVTGLTIAVISLLEAHQEYKNIKIKFFNFDKDLGAYVESGNMGY